MVNKKAVIICTIITILVVGAIVYKNVLKVNEMYATNEISENTTIKKEENKTSNTDNNIIKETEESNVIGKEEKDSQENEIKEDNNLLEENNTTKEDNNGEISKATLINLVEGIVKDFTSVQLAGTKIELDSENNVEVDINIVVSQDVIIKELTVNLQNKIREAIKKTSDLDVKQVNVRIKNIVTQDNENNK